MMEDNMMNVKEVARLQAWLRNYGVPPEKINECIDYIAESPELTTKEKGSQPSEA